MNILGISAYYHDSAAALVRDGEIVAAAQEERFTRKKNDAGFPANARCAGASSEAGLTGKDIDLRRLLRQAVPEVRAAAGNLSRLRAARLHVVPHRDADLDRARSCSRRTCCCKELEGDRPGLGRSGQAAVRRASPQPRGVGVLPLAVRGGRGADHGRRRRMGDDLGRHRARQRAHDRPRRSTFRTRSACSIRRSPTTPASRSTPTNTR